MKLVFDKERNELICRGDPIPWSVIEVEPHDDFSLTIAFSDGSKRIFDFYPLLSLPMYEALRDVSVFLKAQASHGTVDWGNDIDIAPEKLYAEGKIID